MAMRKKRFTRGSSFPPYSWPPFTTVLLMAPVFLLQQIAGVASGGYAGAEVIADIIYLSTGKESSRVQVVSLYALVSPPSHCSYCYDYDYYYLLLVLLLLGHPNIVIFPLLFG